jgi:transcriptional regulator with XRE-family HTH domain
MAKNNNNHTTDTFPDWLQSELDRRGWRATELARRADLDDGIISRALSGARVPSVGSLEKIAAALDIPIEEVLRPAGILPPDKKHDARATELAYKISKLPEPYISIVENMVHTFREGDERASRKKK